MSESEKDRPAVNPHTGMPIPGSGASPPAGSGSGPAPRPESSEGTGAERSDPEQPADPAVKPAPSVQELAIRSALESVMDPEIGLSVIDLGLIREIHLQPERTLVRMMLTTPFCPYAPQLMAEVKQATMGVVRKDCEVEILPDPWSPELMPDPGLLGYSF